MKRSPRSPLPLVVLAVIAGCGGSNGPQTPLDAMGPDDNRDGAATADTAVIPGSDGGTPDIGTADTGVPMVDSGPPGPALSIADVAKVEGNGATSAMTFTVALSAPSDTPVSVAYATADETAMGGGTAPTGGLDYVPASGTLTFAAGVTSQSFMVTINGDVLYEPEETFVVNLTSPVGAPIARGSARGTITNDDLALEINIGNATVDEGDSGTVNAVLSVTLSAASGQEVTVDYATMGVTATAGVDFLTQMGTVTFAPGQRNQTIQVAVTGDLLNEPTEAFLVTLSKPVGAALSDGQGAVTVTDDDLQPVLTVNSLSISEGSSGTKSAAVNVNLSAPSGFTVTANYTTANGTAVGGLDFVLASGSLSFAPGETSKTITITINGDSTTEPDETVVLNLSNATNAIIVGRGNITILNDDGGLPALSISSAQVAEGDTGTSALSFTVTLAFASATTVTVNYATSDGTAIAGGSAAAGGNDFEAASGTVTFAPNETSKIIAITVNGDVLNEADETFQVTLSSAVAAVIASPTATGTIMNDDAIPGLSVDSVAIDEGAAGTREATFTIALSAASGKTVSVNFTTGGGSATAGIDYVARSSVVTLPPGSTGTTIAVTINGDALNEADETFLVTLTAPQEAAIINAQGQGLITNDDPLPALSINNVSVMEGDSGTSTAVFTIVLSPRSGRDVSVAWSTANDTATAGQDYTASSGTVTFPAGTINQAITVITHGDTVDENNENFLVVLTAPQNAAIADGQGLGTIISDDTPLPIIGINDASVVEGDGGTKVLSLTVTMSMTSANTVTVEYDTANGTAIAGADYQPASGTISFAPGETSKNASVTILGEMVHENDETLFVNLKNALGGFVGDSQAVGTITNDDAAPSLSIGDVMVVEGNSGTAFAPFIVTLSQASALTIEVSYATANNTATAGGAPAGGGSDYVSASQKLTFAPGETQKSIPIIINGDTVHEPTQTFFVDLSAPLNATIADPQGQGTITNDDPVPSLSIGDVSDVEGDAGARAFTFTVTLSGASDTQVTVAYTTVDGDARTPSDYQSTLGTISFSPGETSKTLVVLVEGDKSPEANQAFFVDLSNPSGATIADARSVATIVNDD